MIRKSYTGAPDGQPYVTERVTTIPQSPVGSPYASVVKHGRPIMQMGSPVAVVQGRYPGATRVYEKKPSNMLPVAYMMMATGIVFILWAFFLPTYYPRTAETFFVLGIILLIGGYLYMSSLTPKAPTGRVISERVLGTYGPTTVVPPQHAVIHPVPQQQVVYTQQPRQPPVQWVQSQVESPIMDMRTPRMSASHVVSSAPQMVYRPTSRPTSPGIVMRPSYQRLSSPQPIYR